jgi:hypothetical protein
MKLFETSLPQNYSKGLYEEKNYDLAPEHKILYTVFTGVSELLNAFKNKEKPISFVFDRLDGSVIAAAICQYFPNEDDSKPGNWSLVWTFDESDIPENADRYSIVDERSHPFFRGIAGEKWGLKFKDISCLVTLTSYALEQIYKWLDENADSNNEVSVELESVFQARVAVEDGQKVFALEPAGEIKMLIKDDASIEK